MISLGETWLIENETACLEDQGFIGVYANVGNGQGLATFVKKTQIITSETFAHETFSATLVKTKSVDVISLYLSHGFNYSVLQNKLEEWIVDNKSVAIMGDVNLNQGEKKNHDFVKYLDSKNFLQIVNKPTHKAGGTIDHIYINPVLQEKEPLHSQRSVYFSDHDEIVLHIPVNISPN